MAVAAAGRPVTTYKLILLVDGLANTMTTIQASDINILNVAKVTWHMHLSHTLQCVLTCTSAEVFFCAMPACSA